MRVSELIELLKSMPQDAEVILQKDAEGNGYSPLDAVDSDCIYVPDSTWSGYVYSAEWTADEACMDQDEWDELLAQPRSVVLAPIN